MVAEITGVPVLPTTPMLVLLMLVVPVGAWLSGPYLIKRGYDFGYCLAWSLFASMGILELAHFIFALLTGEPYPDFPDMASVVVLAPLGAGIAGPTEAVHRRSYRAIIESRTARVRIERDADVAIMSISTAACGLNGRNKERAQRVGSASSVRWMHRVVAGV